MARYSQPPTFDLFQSPSDLESKPIFTSGEEMNVLDDKILDSNTPDMRALQNPRRSSFDQTPEGFSRRESVWSDMAQQNQDAQQSRHASQISTPLFEPVSNPFARLDTVQTPSFAQPHQQQQQQQQQWPLSAGSGSCTPTPVYEQFPHEYDGSAPNPFNGGAVGAVQHLPYQSIPYRPGSAFPSQTSLPMSPQASQGWASATSDAADAQGKSARGTSFRGGSNLHVRRDGIRKKNARFDIPAERTLGTIDFLISQTTDEDEIKELKQQKRLLRNRQAALDSRQRKKVHTEQLEEDKRRSSSLIKELQEALQEIKLRDDEVTREKNELFDRQQRLHQYVEQLHMEKDEMIRTHTLETGELRKKNTILREHIEKLELNVASSTAAAPVATPGGGGIRDEFADYENITMENAPWDDFCMVNEFPMGADTEPLRRNLTPTPNNSLIAVPKRSDKSDEKQPAQSDLPFSWNAFYMCLLFGAFIASNSSSMSAPAVPPLSEEYRAESANVLRAVLAAAPSESSGAAPSNVVAHSFASSGPSAPPATISGVEMAQMTSNPDPGSGTNLDSLHQNLVAPTREQQREEAFALTAEQYTSLTTMDAPGGDPKPPPSNLQQAYTAMRNNVAQNQPNVKGASDIYSRSLLWDRVPDKVVRDFRRMVKECHSVKSEEDGDAMHS